MSNTIKIIEAEINKAVEGKADKIWTDFQGRLENAVKKFLEDVNNYGDKTSLINEVEKKLSTVQLFMDDGMIDLGSYPELLGDCIKTTITRNMVKAASK